MSMTVAQALDPSVNWGAEPWRTTINTGEILFSEPGRILDCDYRSHWFSIDRETDGSQPILRVHHGGGHDAFGLGYVSGSHIIALLATLDSNARYLLMRDLFDIHGEARRKAEIATENEYKLAFVEGRLKKKKVRGQSAYKVTIEPEKL